MDAVIVLLMLLLSGLLMLGPAVAVGFAIPSRFSGRVRWFRVLLALFGPVVAINLLVVLAWLTTYSGTCGGWLGETSPCSGFGQYVVETLFWAVMATAMPGLAGIVLGLAFLAVRLALKARRPGLVPTPSCDPSPPWLLILGNSFSVTTDMITGPWNMTRRAMERFRHAIGYDHHGKAFTVVEVVPLGDVQWLDRWMPWRQRPVRFVLQPGPERSLPEVRAQLVALLEGDSEIADALAMPPEAAIARLNEATSPSELIDAARAVLSSAS
jgi:hypothetical protein